MKVLLIKMFNWKLHSNDSCHGENYDKNIKIYK